jgi:uncharacterized protein (DUF1800 family)
MESNHLASLLLGFSTKSAESIQKSGIENYITEQLNAKNSLSMPQFIADGPKNLQEIGAIKKEADKGEKASNDLARELNKLSFDWKAFVIRRCNQSDAPLREKINLFFQNHFVVTLHTVKVPFWIYKHYEAINTYSLGNYKTLVKEMVYSNSMIKYLDNHQNKKDAINENLGRELLELFTLGEGHYTEADIKNTALALAGLTFGDEKGVYRNATRVTTAKTVFGKTGIFNIDDVIDVIFEQANTPYFLAEKVLKWFFYDTPPKELIEKYGKLLKDVHFELKPFFQALFTEECKQSTGGNQIKNPLCYLLQVHHDLSLTPNYTFLAFLLKNQGMDIYDQPNVKGWKGGHDWMTTQLYTERNQFIDFVIDGNVQFEKTVNRRLEKFNVDSVHFEPKLTISNKTNAQAIINELCDRMIFSTNPEMLASLGELLKYDFDPKAENANQAILRVYQYLAKSPEFQIV